MKAVLSLLALGAFSGVSANAALKDYVVENHAKFEAKQAARGFFQDKKPSVLGQPQTCKNGFVTIDGEDFPCNNVDFYSFVSLLDTEITDGGHPEGFRAADIWGWLTPTGREFTLLGLDNGAAVIDTTDPVNPCVIAKMPTSRTIHIWADIKVHDNTMYVVKDQRGDDLPETAEIGIEVYDLLPLDNFNCHVEGFNAPKILPNFVYKGHGQCHNLVMNTETGHLYAVGTETCAGGFIMLDVYTDRLTPTFKMCADGDNYTHDGQCLIYDGPDVEHHGKEICFGFNEDSLTIWDFSDFTNPVMLSRTEYPNAAYSHQGWATDDLTKILLDDEVDELCNANKEDPICERLHVNTDGLTGLLTTSTNVFDISDLDAPFLDGVFVHEDLSIDHNLYIFGALHRRGWGGNPPLEYYPDPNYAYLNNYLAGVRILDIHSPNVDEWFEAGFFDIAPDAEDIAFAGAWSGYMHPSGVYAVSSIERGMFLLQPRMAYTEDFPQAPVVTSAPTDGDGGVPPVFGDIETVLIALIALVALLIIAIFCTFTMASRALKANKAAKKNSGVSAKHIIA